VIKKLIVVVAAIAVLATIWAGWNIAREEDAGGHSRRDGITPESASRATVNAPRTLPGDDAQPDTKEPPAGKPTAAASTRSQPKPYTLAEKTGKPNRAALRVRVVDSFDRAIADAPVSLTLSIGGVGRSGPARKTDAAGVAFFEDLSAEEVIGANVRAGSLGRSALLSLTSGRVTEIQFKIAAGFEVRGTVRDLGTGPMAQVFVSLSRKAPDGFRDHASSTTDEDGLYVIRGVPPGEYEVGISGGSSAATGNGSKRTRKVEYHERKQGQLDVGAPGPVIKDITLGRLNIEGVVRDAVTGAPIANVDVTFQRPNFAMTRTDKTGKFRMASLPHGLYTILLKKDGYALRFVHEVDLPEHETARVDLTIERAGRLHIHLRDTEHRPVPGEHWIRFHREPKGGWSSNLIADSKGHILSKVVPLGSFNVSVEGGGWKGGPVAVEIKPGDNEVRIPVTRGSTAGSGIRALSGIVRDSRTQAPIEGVRLRLRAGMTRDAYTDEKGTFVFEDLPTGAYTVWVEKDGFANHSVSSVRIEAGKEKLIELELDPAATVHLRLTDAAGRPVEAKVHLVYVRETEGVGRGLPIETDEDGRVTFRRLPPGDYTLKAIVGKRSTERIKRTIEPGANTIEMQLTPE